MSIGILPMGKESNIQGHEWGSRKPGDTELTFSMPSHNSKNHSLPACSLGKLPEKQERKVSYSFKVRQERKGKDSGKGGEIEIMPFFNTKQGSECQY
jgi:hypothetical protein